MILFIFIFCLYLFPIIKHIEKNKYKKFSFDNINNIKYNNKSKLKIQNKINETNFHSTNSNNNNINNLIGYKNNISQQNTTKNFEIINNKNNNYINFIEPSEEQILEHKNYIYKTSSLLNTFSYKFRGKRMKLEKTKKMLTNDNLTDEELAGRDLVKRLEQNEINELLYKKIKIISNKPINFSDQYEKYYYGSVANLAGSYYNNFPYDINDNSIPDVCEGRIDLLWTYVNATDPIWFNEYSKYRKEIKKNRYRDYGSLKFSMRSVYKNLKFIKHWFLVLSGPSQIPTFLNMKKIDERNYQLLDNNNNEYNNIQIHIVYHEDIFPNKTFLPTFSSDAIEAALPFVKNISECYIYLNDDFFIKENLPPNFFIKKNGKINIFKNAAYFAPYYSGSIYDKTLIHSNEIISELYGFKRRLYLLHNIYFFRKSKLLELNNKFKLDFALSRYHRFRNETNLNIPFLHNIYAEVEKFGDVVIKNKGWGSFYYINNKGNTDKIYKDIKKLPELKCFCINDDFVESSDSKNTEEFIFNEFNTNMEQIFPEKLPFEK